MKFHDSQNQLIREDNQAAGKSWTWEYDDAGNILNRKEYAHTTGNLGTVLDTVTYGYGNANWGDLLTSYDGQTITYDSIGNPLNDGTWTYTWEHGRQLASMTDGTTTWTYTYDANGMRTSRTNGSSTYSYVYNGGQLTQMVYAYNSTATTFNFYYDASGAPLSVNINGTDYYYVTDLQGDIVAILNASGTKVASYEYDAWGKILSSSIVPSSATDVYLAFNPLRYRAYVYDQESELYYLQSRYYNPEVGRFLNSDALVSTGQGLLGNNMFAYCGNNPIRYEDPDGQNLEEALVTDDDNAELFPNVDGYAPSNTGQSQQSANGSSYSYTAPTGGGGITSSVQIGTTTVTFGHGGRHMDLGDISGLETAIANNVVTQPPTTGVLGKISISYCGTDVTYHYWTMSSIHIHVGTYYPTIVI